MRHRAISIGLLLVALLALPRALSLAAEPLPPPIGPAEPKVAPLKEGSLYTQTWFVNSFLDLRDDYEQARKAGKRFAIVFEQNGCPYCVKMHTEVLAQRYINDYVRTHFDVIQLDLFGAREVTDFDGRKMTEKKLAERWGVIFTPTIIFLKHDLTGLEGKFGRVLEASERMPAGMGAGTFYDMFVWVRLRLYEQDPNFQRFHIARHQEREALKK
ncbi:MAG TPA: thioredoxin family protein [Hyphomicrobiaceae bacterium]|nr:thioredoxin family protein [Hyphomicrobiaceae bacterium]